MTRPPKAFVAGVATLAVLVWLAVYRTEPLPHRDRAPSGTPAAAAVAAAAEVANATQSDDVAARVRVGAASPGGSSGGSPARAAAAGSPATWSLVVPAGTPGVTDTTIRLGFVWEADKGDPAAEPDLFPNKDQAQAVIDYLNARGGLAGRQIVPVWYEYMTYSHSTMFLGEEKREEEARAACAAWTGDEPVFAFFTWWGFTTQSLLDCARENRIIYLDADRQGPVISQSVAAKMAPYYYATLRPHAETHNRMYVNELAAIGFFEGSPKVGVVIEDDPAAREAADGGLRPALAALGIEPVAEVYYPEPFQSLWPSYVTQFQLAGVDRVLFPASSLDSLPPVGFMLAAAGQGYEPRYGVTTTNDPVYLALLAEEFGAGSQVKNVVGAGWSSFYDTGTFPSDAPAFERCQAIAKAAKLPIGYIQQYCDGLFFLEASLSRADELSAHGIARALKHLGPYESVLAYEQRFAEAQPFGVRHVRGFKFHEDCVCFKYMTELHPAAGL